MILSASAIEQATQFMPELLVFRGLPYAGFILYSGRIDAKTRAACASGFGSLVLAAVYNDAAYVGRLGIIVLGMLYYLAVAIAFHRICEGVVRGTVTLAAAVCLAAFFFMFLPVVLHAQFAASAVQVLGWELSLGFVSYATEARRRHKNLPLGELLIFLFMSQTLVFSNRGMKQAPSEPRASAGWRIALGVLALWGGLILGSVGMRGVIWVNGALGRAGRLLGTCVHGIFALGVQYAGHSGRASMSIGAMGLLGWRIPERYHYPFLASSPDDFWRRWNRYVGMWCWRHVYLPMSRALSGQPFMRGLRVGSAVSLVGTFALVGLMHDLDQTMRTFQATTHGLLGFTIVGAVVLASNVIRRLYLGASRHMGSVARLSLQMIGRAATCCIIAISARFLVG